MLLKMKLKKEFSVNLDPKYKIIKYNKKYFQSLVKLFYDSHQLIKSTEFFKYRLSKTPYGNPITYLMKYENKIVGSHSIRPLLLKIKNHDVLGGLSYNLMTHPDHRNKGIFINLVQKTQEEVKKQNYNFVLGFASSNAINGFSKKLKHTNLGPINFIKIKKINFKAESLSKIHYHWFPKDLEQLNNEYSIGKKFLIRLERNKNFLDWRYKNNPVYRYITIYEKGKYFGILQKIENSLYLIDFFGILRES